MSYPNPPCSVRIRASEPYNHAGGNLHTAALELKGRDHMKSSRKRNVARKAKGSHKPRTASTPIGSASPHPNPRAAQAVQQAEPQAARFAESQPASTQPASTQAPAQSTAAQPDSPASAGFVSQNRANVQHSTGPRTPEGKAASSQNAFKHGLSIQRHAVLRDEDPALYAQFLAELREIYEPRSRREDLAVDDIAQCRWALARFDKAEAVCLEKLTDWYNDPEAFPGEEILGAGESLAHAATVLTDFDEKDRRFVEPDTHYPTFDKIHRYRTYWERKHTRALAEFDRAQRARHTEASRLRAEAAHQRAEAQSQRQAEAHALKQELALAREARQRELHELRVAALQAKHPSTPPEPASPNKSASSGAKSSEEEAGSPEEQTALALLESILSAPTPVTEQDFLRSKLSQAQNGFVSQNERAA